MTNIVTKIDRRKELRDRPKGLNMDEPICKYETTIATIPVHIADIKEDIGEIKTAIKDLSDTIGGNGQVGLVTQAALNKASITRLWWMLPCLMTIFGIIIGVTNYLT